MSETVRKGKKNPVRKTQTGFENILALYIKYPFRPSFVRYDDGYVIVFCSFFILICRKYRHFFYLSKLFYEGTTKKS